MDPAYRAKKDHIGTVLLTAPSYAKPYLKFVQTLLVLHSNSDEYVTCESLVVTSITDGDCADLVRTVRDFMMDKDTFKAFGVERDHNVYLDLLYSKGVKPVSCFDISSEKIEEFARVIFLFACIPVILCIGVKFSSDLAANKVVTKWNASSVTTELAHGWLETHADKFRQEHDRTLASAELRLAGVFNATDQSVRRIINTANETVRLLRKDVAAAADEVAVLESKVRDSNENTELIRSDLVQLRDEVRAVTQALFEQTNLTASEVRVAKQNLTKIFGQMELMDQNLRVFEDRHREVREAWLAAETSVKAGTLAIKVEMKAVREDVEAFMRIFSSWQGYVIMSFMMTSVVFFVWKGFIPWVFGYEYVHARFKVDAKALDMNFLVTKIQLVCSWLVFLYLATLFANCVHDVAGVVTRGADLVGGMGSAVSVIGTPVGHFLSAVGTGVGSVLSVFGAGVGSIFSAVGSAGKVAWNALFHPWY